MGVGERREGWAGRASVADGLFLLVAAAALITRLAGLEYVPLSSAEAREALAVWRFLQPGRAVGEVASPAYFSLTSLLVPFLGDRDAVMRLVPALFGTAVTLLPWLLRFRIGVVGALTASVLLIASPLAAAVSHTAGGDAIALFAILLTAVAVLRYLDARDARWLYTLAAALALGLASAPLFYSGLLTLLAAGMMARWMGPPLSENGFGRPAREVVVGTAVFGAAFFILLSTRLLTFPAGLGSAARILGDWLAQFAWVGDLQALLDPFMALARYEVVLLPLGIFAIVWGIWRGPSLASFFVYWLLSALFLILLQRGVMLNALLVPLAGSLLLGLFTHHLLSRGTDLTTWLLAAGLIVIGGALLANLTRYLRLTSGDQQSVTIATSVLLVASAIFAVYVVWTLSENGWAQGLWLAVLALSVFYMWGTAWQLTRAGGNDPRERWVSEGTAQEVRVMAALMRDISQQVNNAPYDLDVVTAVDQPALRWYLRDFWRLQASSTLPLNAQNQVLLTLADNPEPALGSDYLGMDFGLVQAAGTAEILSATPVLDALRWWLLHESAQPIEDQRAIMWVRADLVQPND